MKNIYKLLFLVLLITSSANYVNAQVASYTFAQSNGTYTPISGGSLLGGTANDDERFVDPAALAGGTTTTGVGFPIGFNFTFNGNTFDRIAVNANGWITLGQSALTPSVNCASSSAYTPLSSTSTATPTYLRSRIVAFGRDLAGQTGSELRVQTIGTTPNQILVVQWSNYSRYLVTGDALNFQIRLKETSNVVEVAYGTNTFGTTANTAQLGLGGTTNTDFNNRATTTNWNASTAGTLNTSAMTVNGVTPPASGLTLAWTPPVPCSGAPSAGSIPATLGFCSGSTINITATGVTTGVSGIALQWQESDDNGVVDLWANTATGTGSTTNSYTSAALTNAIFYRLRAICTTTNDTVYSNVSAVTAANCNFDVAYTTGASYTSIMPANGGTGTVMPGWVNTTSGDDNTSTTVSLTGTTFTYQGAPVTGFQACTNGWMTFNTANTATSFTNNLTSATTPKVLAPFWDDLVLTGQTYANRDACMRYKVSGTLGSGTAVITMEWAGLERYNIAGPNLNFQVKLYESDNHIEYIYGNFEGFDGTVTTAYTYSIGYNGSNPAGTTAVDRFGMQTGVTNHFAASDPANHIVMPACYSMFTFTPGTYTGPTSAPTIPVPTNDDVASAALLNVNGGPCTSYCGTYFTSQNATDSGSGQACATTSGNEDDDVWFKFQTGNLTQDYVVKLRCSPNYDGVLELLDSAYNTVSCANATGAGLIENINALGLVDSGATYYVRIFHNGATIGTSNGQFSICVSQVVNPPANDTICSAVTLTNATTCIPVSGTTIVATQSPQANACTGTPDDDVWYKFTAVTPTPTITVQSGNGYNAAVQIMSSSNNTCAGTLTSVSCVNATSTGGVETYTGAGLTVGNTYFVRIYHNAGGAGTGNFTVCYVEPAPVCPTYSAPANNAINRPISGINLQWAAATGAANYDVYMSTSYDSVFVNSPTALLSAAQTALLKFTGALTVGTKYYWKVNSHNAIGSSTGCEIDSFTTVPPCTTPPVGGLLSGPATGNVASIGVYSDASYTGTTVQWQSSVNANGPFANIAGATTFTNQNITWNIADTIYYRTKVSTPGCPDAYSDTISTIVGAMLGDDVCNAITVIVGTNGPYNTTGSTTQTGEVIPPVTGYEMQDGWGDGAISNTMWFKFVAPASGHVSIQSPGFDTQLALWSAATCSDLLVSGNATLIAANDDDPNYTTHTGSIFSSFIDSVMCLVPGQTYFIQLDPYTSPGGSTTIVITDLGTIDASFTGLSPLYCGGAAPVTMTPVIGGGAFSGNHVAGNLYSPTYGSVDTVVYTLHGCYSDTVIVGTYSKPATPTVTMSMASSSICANDTLVLTSSYVGGNTWSTTSTTDTINVAAAGSYTVVYTDANGCNSDPSTAVVVVVNTNPPAPVVTAFGNTSFCQGGNVAMVSNQTSGNTWSNGDLNSAISATTTGAFYATYTDANGCVSDTSNNINVTVYSLPTAPVVTASGTLSFCPGDSVILYSSYNSNNVWSTTDIDTAIVVYADGTYSVTYTNTNGCSATSANQVVSTYTGMPVADFSHVETGLQVDFTDASTNAGTYAWDFGDGTGTSTNASPTYTYTAAGTYTVTQIVYGCGSDTITYDVTVVDPLGLKAVAINNLTIAPNPSNGLLNINFTTNANELSVKLMSANGQVVMNEYYNNFNGKYTNTLDLSKLANGIYFLQISNSNGIVNKKVVLTK